MIDQIRIAVIGAGNWGINLVRNCHALGVLDCVAEASESSRENVRKEFQDLRLLEDWRPLLADDRVDAVIIATPAPTHYEIARAFLEAGKDVYVEKPITLHAEEAERLRDLASEQSAVLMTGHLLLYQPAIHFLRDYLATGNIGRIFSIHLERRNLGKARSAENALWSLGVHDVAMMVYLLDAEPVEVHAAGHCGLQQRIEDNVYLSLRFEEGPLGFIHNSWLWPEKKRDLVVVGSEGMLRYDEIAQRIIRYEKTIRMADLSNEDNGEEEIFQGDAQPLRLALEHFLDCIRNRVTPRSGGDNAVAVVRILEKAQEQLNHRHG